MNDLKITINQLKNYLDTELKVSLLNFPLGYHERIFELDCGHDFHYYLSKNKVRPICYRLSDLDKFIPELGFVPLKRLVNDDQSVDEKILISYIERNIKNLSSFQVFALIDYEDGESRKEHLISFYPYGSQRMTPFEFMDKLFQWHFWPFGDEYFQQGLVIDKLNMI